MDNAGSTAKGMGLGNGNGMGMGMGVGMNHWEREGLGTKMSFPLTSIVKVYLCTNFEVSSFTDYKFRLMEGVLNLTIHPWTLTTPHLRVFRHP